MLQQPLRIIDANLNRSSEGLRVLEDIARFLLSDVELGQRLKSLRHDLSRETKSLNIGLLSYRDSEHDVGHILSSNQSKLDIKATSFGGPMDLVRANAKRVEEALRVIEEIAKFPEMNSVLNSSVFEQMRFTIYGLERDLISRISRRNKVAKISGLYTILDKQFLADRDEVDVAKQIIEGGAQVIQLRDKQGKKGEMLLVAQKISELCNQAGILFVINDYLDLTLVVNADGLHIGQEDLPVPLVRRALPIDRIIGCSITTIAQAKRAQDNGADYIAVGSIFPTRTKKEATVVGVNILKELKRTISTPVVAIGGINPNNVDEVVAAGADAVAVISAVLGEQDVKGTVQKLVTKINLKREQCQSQ